MVRLSDEHRERIREHFPEENIPDGRPGRKPIPTRKVHEAVLWILNTGVKVHVCRERFVVPAGGIPAAVKVVPAG